MVQSVLVKSADDLQELYRFLLMRAQEEEANGSPDIGRTYRDYAASVHQEIGRLAGSKGTRQADEINWEKAQEGRHGQL